MSRCRHCLATAEPNAVHCHVCGILREKCSADLTPRERGVRRHARIVRAVAMLHLAGAGAGLIALCCCGSSFPFVASFLIVINITLALGLSRFALWAYRLTIVFYFLIAMINIASVNLPAVFLILTLLYGIGNSTAKALFERNIA